MVRVHSGEAAPEIPEPEEVNTFDEVLLGVEGFLRGNADAGIQVAEYLYTRTAQEVVEDVADGMIHYAATVVNRVEEAERYGYSTGQAWYDVLASDVLRTTGVANFEEVIRGETREGQKLDTVEAKTEHLLYGSEKFVFSFYATREFYKRTFGKPRVEPTAPSSGPQFKT